MKRLIPILLLLVSSVVQAARPATEEEIRQLEEAEEARMQIPVTDAFQLNCSQTSPTMNFILIAETRTNVGKTFIDRVAMYIGHTDTTPREGIFEEF